MGCIRAGCETLQGKDGSGYCRKGCFEGHFEAVERLILSIWAEDGWCYLLWEWDDGHDDNGEVHVYDQPTGWLRAGEEGLK